MRIETSYETIAPKVQTLTISRTMTPNGWSARIKFEPNEILRKTASYDRQVAVMEIHPDGRSTSYDVGGRRLTLTGTPVINLPGARGGRAEFQMNREDRRINPRGFDVGSMIEDRASRRAALAKLRAKTGAPVRDEKGHDRFGRVTATGGTEVIVDPELEAVVEIRSNFNGATTRTKYEYVDVGAGLLRHKMTYERPRTANTGASTISLTISNVSINGREVAR